MEKKTKLSESFIVGVIALVFLIVGYQTALFVYRASVMKIASNRDAPDTVCVYMQENPGVPNPAGEICNMSLQAKESKSSRDETKVQRKSSQHSAVAEAVRLSPAYRKVESFRFNPNTVNVEELCRLGFSQKQAQAIENYRSKGGRFHRKEDFAKSYVVSDSIYRRLEPYVDIPIIDLNLADSAAFDALPGIGGWFAQKMVEHRNVLKGYSYKEQLLDIYRFTEEKYHALEDLIAVSPEYVTPYPLWSLPADSLRLHPYIKDYETARSIVVFRENTPQSSWTVGALIDAGIFVEEKGSKLLRCYIAMPSSIP